jgi:hypothetical protein
VLSYGLLHRGTKCVCASQKRSTSCAGCEVATIMRYINQLKLIQTLIERKTPDSKTLLADVNYEAVIRALKRSKDGLPKPVRFTNAPMEEEYLAQVPLRDKEHLWNLYARVREVPEEVLPKLLTLQRQYPDVPAIYNYIGLAYFYSHQEREYFEVLLETTARFPEYLFGKTALAEYYLDHNESHKIPKILDGKFELCLHYPTVNLFHVSQVRSFFSVAGVYFARVNNLARALYHYGILTGIDPDHPATKKVGDEIILQEIDNWNHMISKRMSRRKNRL